MGFGLFNYFFFFGLYSNLPVIIVDNFVSGNIL